MRGGLYYYSYGNLGSQSSYGYYWSRRLDNATRGNYLDFYSGRIYPRNSYDRGYAFALRCLASSVRGNGRRTHNHGNQNPELIRYLS